MFELRVPVHILLTSKTRYTLQQHSKTTCRWTRVTRGCHLKLHNQISCHETNLQYKVRKMCQISYCHGQNAGYHTSDPHIRHRWKNCNSKSNNQVICESKPSKTTLRKSVMDLIWKISNASLTQPNIFLTVFCVKKWLKISFWLIFFCRNISE